MQLGKFLENSMGIENDFLANKNIKDMKRRKILANSEGSQVLSIPGDIRQKVRNIHASGGNRC